MNLGLIVLINKFVFGGEFWEVLRECWFSCCVEVCKEVWFRFWIGVRCVVWVGGGRILLIWLLVWGGWNILDLERVIILFWVLDWGIWVLFNDEDVEDGKYILFKGLVLVWEIELLMCSLFMIIEFIIFFFRDIEFESGIEILRFIIKEWRFFLLFSTCIFFCVREIFLLEELDG